MDVSHLRIMIVNRCRYWYTLLNQCPIRHLETRCNGIGTHVTWFKEHWSGGCTDDRWIGLKSLFQKHIVSIHWDLDPTCNQRTLRRFMNDRSIFELTGLRQTIHDGSSTYTAGKINSQKRFLCLSNFQKKWIDCLQSTREHAVHCLKRLINFGGYITQSSCGA